MPRFGVNLNNREPLIAPAYDLAALLDLSTEVEHLGFDSVWVGDSLFSKPRYEPLALLAAISQRTSRVRLGTACLVTSTRNPLYLALEWATLDVLSGGRTILGACKGNPEEGVRREFAALGLDHTKAGSIWEEGLHVLRTLWTEGEITFHGDHFDYDGSFYQYTDVSLVPRPLQHPHPPLVMAAQSADSVRWAGQRGIPITQMYLPARKHGTAWLPIASPRKAPMASDWAHRAFAISEPCT